MQRADGRAQALRPSIARIRPRRHRFTHVMLKEIFERPRAIGADIAEESPRTAVARLSGRPPLNSSARDLGAQRACGTSFNAGSVARYSRELCPCHPRRVASGVPIATRWCRRTSRSSSFAVGETAIARGGSAAPGGAAFFRRSPLQTCPEFAGARVGNVLLTRGPEIESLTKASPRSCALGARSRSASTWPAARREKTLGHRC